MLQKLKSFISKAHSTLMQYYQRDLPITVQTDTSKHSLVTGTCLLEHGKSISFTAKSLMDAETWYANAEQELLAVTYGCECCYTYLYGHFFTIEIDHTPQEMIALKN